MSVRKCASAHFQTDCWKYGEHAYRYCQHDVGHAFGAVCVAAAALGWRVALETSLSDDEVAGLLGVDRNSDFTGVEGEHPDMIALVATDPGSVVPCKFTEGAVAGVRASNWAGKANRLSPDRVDWPEITAVEAATVKPSTASLPFADSGATSARALGPRCETVRAAVIIRQRRSAVQLDGKTGLSLDAFFRMLARTLPDRSHPPWRAINFSARVHLCLFVHRIDKLSPGLYVLVRDGARLDAFRDACHPRFAWEHVESSDIPLYALYQPPLTLTCASPRSEADGHDLPRSVRLFQAWQEASTMAS